MSFLTSVTPLVILLYLAFKELKSGSSALNEKIKKEYKEMADVLEKRIKNIEESNKQKDTEIIQYKTEIAEFKGIIKEKDRQLDRYEEIFQNRNPEMIKMLESINTFLREIHMTGLKNMQLIKDNKTI